MVAGAAPMTTRAHFLERALSLLGVPYIWGGKSSTGIDCSGLVTVALFDAGGPDWRSTRWSGRLHAELPSVDVLSPGDLVFYGPSETAISHVMVHVAEGLLVGACGGDAGCRTLNEAARRKARVKFRHLADYRPHDIRGFRRLPLETPNA